MNFSHNDIVKIASDPRLGRCSIVGSHRMPDERLLHFAAVRQDSGLGGVIAFFDDDPEAELVCQGAFANLLSFVNPEAAIYYPMEHFVHNEPVIAPVFRPLWEHYGLNFYVPQTVATAPEAVTP